MSTISTPPDIDFWEFVSCSKCHLPYGSDFGKSVPFWLTECGHIICNHHLSPSTNLHLELAVNCSSDPDQSCPSCGTARIQVAPLQQDLEAPMSDWFRSVPLALDSIAHAAKFQQEAMGRQIRFYRARHQQLRVVLENMRSELAELKKSFMQPFHDSSPGLPIVPRSNDTLLRENEQLKQQLGQRQSMFSPSAIQDPFSASLNNNGKRPFGMSNPYDHPSRRPRTDSSPHNAVLPASGSNRLTLPVDQHAPELARPGEAFSPQASKSQYPQGSSYSVQGPASNSIEKFAYVPPQPPRTALPGFSHIQMTPRLMKAPQHAAQQGNYTNIGRPPTRLNMMGPPPVPESRTQSTGFNLSGIPSTSSGRRKFIPASQRFVPPSTPMQVPNNPIGQHQRHFFTKTNTHGTENK